MRTTLENVNMGKYVLGNAQRAIYGEVFLLRPGQSVEVSSHINALSIIIMKGVIQVLRNARGGGWVYAQALRSVTRGWGGGLRQRYVTSFFFN